MHPLLHAGDWGNSVWLRPDSPCRAITRFSGDWPRGGCVPSEGMSHGLPRIARTQPARRRAAWSLWAAAALLASLAQAAPAPWYYWRSKVDGARVCAQVSPGHGWVRDSPAYDGAGCQPRPKVYVLPMR